jgi:hypothetical protein
VRTWDETKPAWMTTELYVLIAAVVGTIAAGASNGSWDAKWFGRSSPLLPSATW